MRPETRRDRRGQKQGTLDKRGHSEGWKLARSVSRQRFADLVRPDLSRFSTPAGSEVTVVTDHGWLLDAAAACRRSS
jgi:hypothetical protein